MESVCNTFYDKDCHPRVAPVGGGHLLPIITLTLSACCCCWDVPVHVSGRVWLVVMAALYACCGRCYKSLCTTLIRRTPCDGIAAGGIHVVTLCMLYLRSQTIWLVTGKQAGGTLVLSMASAVVRILCSGCWGPPVCRAGRVRSSVFCRIGIVLSSSKLDSGDNPFAS